MGETFTLNSPFLNFTWNQIPDHWRAILAAWILLWLAVCIAITYLYAVVFASWVGFETAALVGIMLLVFGQQSGDS